MPDFQDVTRPKHSAIRTSALFTYVSRMSKSKLGPVKSKLIADGNAYLLIFNDKIDSNALVLFAEDGYAFDTSDPPHIRLDREYGNPGSSIYRNKFFAHWHYTERLVRESDGSIVVLHYYFHRCMLLDIVVTRADGTKYTLDHITKVKLETNTERAITVIAALFKELDTYKEQLNLKFEALIAETSNNSYVKATTVAALRSKLQQLQDISEEINELEQGFVDCRFEIVRDRLEWCIAKKLQEQEATKAPQALQDDGHASPETTRTALAKLAVTDTKQVSDVSEVAKSNVIPVKSLKVLLDETNKLVSAYQTAVVTDLVALDTTRQGLINDLLIALFSCNDPASQKSIEDMQSKMLAFKSLPEYLMMYLLSGDSENFITLYAIAGLKITPQMFAKYIGILMTSDFAKRESEHVKICEYLYANSSEYVVFLEFVTALSDLLHGTIGDDRAVICSLPYMLVCKELYDFFCMLIKQTRDPDMRGLSIGKYTMSLILSIMPMSNSEIYVDFLLAQGARTEQVYHSHNPKLASQIHASSMYAPLSQISMNINRSESQDGTTEDINFLYNCYINIARSQSCLAASLLRHLMPDERTREFALRASLYQVAYATAFFLSIGGMVARTHSNFPVMRNYSTNDAKIEDLQKLASEGVFPRNHFAFGFYFPTPAGQNKASLCLEIFIARITSATEAECQSLVKQLADKMLQYKKAGDWKEAAVMGEATWYCANYLKPTVKSHTFILWLLRELRSILQECFNTTAKTAYKTLSSMVQTYEKGFIDQSEFSAELRAKPVGAKAKPR